VLILVASVSHIAFRSASFGQV